LSDRHRARVAHRTDTTQGFYALDLGSIDLLPPSCYVRLYPHPLFASNRIRAKKSPPPKLALRVDLAPPRLCTCPRKKSSSRVRNRRWRVGV